MIEWAMTTLDWTQAEANLNVVSLIVIAMMVVYSFLPRGKR